MKKLLGILVLGLLLSVYEPTYTYSSDRIYYGYASNAEGTEVFESTSLVDVLTAGTDAWNKCQYKYTTGCKIITAVESAGRNAYGESYSGSSSSSSQSSGISFTIKDKKEDCKAIGFKPNTEKFADCVLRLVELDVKRKVNDPSMASQSQANQQIANELKKQNNLRQSEFLMGLSQQLLNPSSPASTMTTCRWAGQFLNCW